MSKSIVGVIDPVSWKNLQEMPMASPPPGVIPNFTNREYNGRPVLITGVIGLVLVSLALGVRIYAKALLFRKIKLDDYIYMIGWPFGVGAICLFIAMVNGGVYGHHAWDVQIKELTKPVLVRSYFTTFFMGPFQWLSRLVLFSLILTAFAPLRYTKTLVWIGVIVSGAIIWGASLYVMVECRPVGGVSREAWLMGMAGPGCASTSGAVPKINLIIGSTTVVTDFYIFILPLPAVFQLRLPWKKKLGVLLVFSAAFGACISSVVSLYYRTKHIKSQDVTYITPPIFVTCIIEITVSLLLPCVSSMTKIYHTYKTKVVSNISATFTSSTRKTERVSKKGINGRGELDLLDTGKSTWHSLDSLKSTDAIVLFPVQPEASYQMTKMEECSVGHEHKHEDNKDMELFTLG